jgi:hypothetical protein
MIGSARGRYRLFAFYFARRLIFAQAQKCRLAEQAFIGPVIEFDLAYQFRLDPFRASGRATSGEIFKWGFWLF